MEIRSSFEPSTDLTHCICREDVREPASSYIVRSRQADSRTIINYNGLPEMTAEEFASVTTKLGEKLGWCHFEVRSSLLWTYLPALIASLKGRIPDFTLSCIHHLRQHYPTVKISVEVEKPGRDGLQDLAAIADVVFYSKSWAQVR